MLENLQEISCVLGRAKQGRTPRNIVRIKRNEGERGPHIFNVWLLAQREGPPYYGGILNLIQI